MHRAPRRLVPSLVLAVCALTFAAAESLHAQERAAVAGPAALPKPTAPEELQKRARYERAEFTMDAHPPVSVGDGVFAETLRFPSPVDTGDPERNDVVHARLFRTEEPSAAAVVALGGWKFDPLTPKLAQELARTGIQVLWIEIPYQGYRTPKGGHSGELTLSADIARDEAAFVQLAQDVGRGVDWLVRERGVDPKRLGLFGTSLGGFAAATLYGMDARWRAVVPQLAGADIASVLLSDNWLTREIGEELRARGYDDASVRAALRAMSPGTWADPQRKDGVLLIAAGEDEIVPLDTTRDLQRRYGGADLVVIPDAPHVDMEGLKSVFPKVRAHFEKLLLPAQAASGEERGAPDGGR